ncbi:MAG: hypothetical protein Q7T55_09070, partial [Solirubrobacteraceae bacterium]|nr:hypothetical protein [Solirubrobacteraceae bacterium]
MEATPAMQLAYGRHPNGFYGLVEQLRGWSVDAPFSQTSNGTGFRMKLFFYGANTAPGYPSTGFFPRYANGGYDNSQPSWNGAGGELFAAEAAVGTYAAGTNGNVKIRPALVESKRLFDSNNVSGRIQLVIILGHSAITDAGGDLGTAVADLEASGVQIFSNVLRRFSSITPDEQMAANYLSPLASDPMQSHFTFTTIDTLRQEFLDKFCDPSSGTGKILNVSRDRTLPCNWLNGQTECQIQGSCVWNASARVTCPLPDQCANMGCVSLPDALAKKYSCENCKYTGGAFQCDSGQAYRAPVGLCVTAPCMMNSQSTCTGSCTW